MTQRVARGRLTVALAVAAIFAGRFAVAAWFDPGRDGDIAWQQWLGLHVLRTGSLPFALGPETFTAAGAHWVPQEWALSIAVALTVGTPWFVMLAALTTLAAASALLFTALSARALGASTIAAAFAVTCVAFSMLESYGIRAQVFGWALLAAVMYLLRCAPDRAKWWIVPLVALWANLHASAMLAPALIALWTAGTALQARGWNENVRRYVLLTLACTCAVFATPLGYRLPLYALELLHSPIRSLISEWQPSGLSAVSFTLGALALIVTGCVVGFERSRRLPEVLLFVAVTWLAVSAVRNAPICAIVIAPAVAARLGRFLPEHLRVNTLFLERPALALLYAGAFAAAALSGAVLSASPEFAQGNLPRGAIAKLAEIPGMHRLYCEDFAWCSLALQHGNMREFIDGRCDPFPLTVWKDYVAVFKANGRWRSVLDRRGVDAILVERSRALARELPLWHDWKLVYSDEKFRLFIRAGRARPKG